MNDGVELKVVPHPEGDPLPDDFEFNPESLETVEIDIPMNERIKELAEQAGLEELGDGDWCSLNHPDVRAEHLEHFAELVRQEEREACAKLCDDWLVKRDDICEVAKAIRARKETT